MSMSLSGNNLDHMCELLKTRPANEISRVETPYLCPEDGSTVDFIRGESSCTTNCCFYSSYYYWCNVCEDIYDWFELKLPEGMVVETKWR